MIPATHFLNFEREVRFTSHSPEKDIKKSDQPLLIPRPRKRSSSKSTASGGSPRDIVINDRYRIERPLLKFNRSIFVVQDLESGLDRSDSFALKVWNEP